MIRNERARGHYLLSIEHTAFQQMGQTASKAELQNSLQALLHYNISPDEYEFWDAIWRKPSSSMEEVFALLSPEEVRYLRDKRFDNFATLYSQAVVQLCESVASPPDDNYARALTCARVLTRIVPILMEKGDLSDAPSEIIEQLCWSTGEETQENKDQESNIPEKGDEQLSQPTDNAYSHDFHAGKENKGNSIESTPEQKLENPSESNIADTAKVAEVYEEVHVAEAKKAVHSSEDSRDITECAPAAVQGSEAEASDATEEKSDAPPQMSESSKDITESNVRDEQSDTAKASKNSKDVAESNAEMTGQELATNAGRDNVGRVNATVDEHTSNSVTIGVAVNSVPTAQAAEEKKNSFDQSALEQNDQAVLHHAANEVVQEKTTPLHDNIDDSAYVIVSVEGESQLVSVDSSESVIEVSVENTSVSNKPNESAALLVDSSKECNIDSEVTEKIKYVLDEVERSRLDEVELSRLEDDVMDSSESVTAAALETADENLDLVGVSSTDSTTPLVDADSPLGVAVGHPAVENVNLAEDSSDVSNIIIKPTEDLAHLPEDAANSSSGAVENAATTADGGAEAPKASEDNVASNEGSNDPEPKPVSRRTLAALTIRAAMHMLFMPQFTYRIYEVPSLRKTRDFDIADDLLYQDQLRAKAGFRVKKVKEGLSLDPAPTLFVWSPGAGVTTCVADFRVSQKYDKNRIEFLRMLLASCCDPLYCPSDEYSPLASRWLLIATAADAPKAICLFYSLLNTILSFDPSAIDDLRHPNHKKLVDLSAQVLCVLLDYGTPGSPDPVVDYTGAPCVETETTTKPGFNIFRTILARIDSGYDLDFIYDGFMRHFRRLHEAQTGIVRGRKLQSFRELLVLFWKFLQENPYFLKHLMSKRDLHELLVPLCYLMNKSRSDPAHIRLVHVCTFILLKLSGERQFSTSLNRPFDKKFAADFPSFRGCHADLLALTLHKLIVNGAHNFSALYSGFLTILANISPYWKSMSYVTAKSLVNLFQLFSSEQYLYSGDAAYKRVHLLLDIYDNIIQYQSHGNDFLLLEIIRYRTNFEELALLTLEQAQAEVRVLEQSSSTAGTTLGDNGHSQGAKGDDSDSQVASAAGRRFEPTEEWLEELKDHRGLETVLRVLKHFVPIVEDLKSRGISGEEEILALLNETTMVGLLPVPHRLEIKKYEPNEFTWLWLTSFLWGSIFAQNLSIQLFDAKYIELFQFERIEVDEDDEDEDEE